MSEPNPVSSLIDIRLNRRMFAGGALLAAGLSRLGPIRAAAAALNPIDIPGAVCGIASPFSDNGFNGNSSGFFYTPLGGTSIGGLTADQGNAIATGFQAGFSFPQNEKVVEGASGKGSDAFFNLSGFLFDTEKHALAGAKAFMAVNLPSGITPDSETLTDGSTYLSYSWQGTPDGYTVDADGYRGVTIAGKTVIALDWADFTEPQSDDEIANLKAQISAAIDASRKGYPLAEGVLRINDSDQVVFNILKGFGSTFGEGSDNTIGDYLTYASAAGTYVRSTGELSVLATSQDYSVATEELTFDSAASAKSFFDNRRDQIANLDQSLSRTRTKSDPKTGISGAAQTSGDYIVTTNPSGSIVGYETTVRFDSRVLSVTFTNSDPILPAVSAIGDVGSDIRDGASGLSLKAMAALNVGKTGDAIFEGGFGRAVAGGAL